QQQSPPPPPPPVAAAKGSAGEGHKRAGEHSGRTVGGGGAGRWKRREMLTGGMDSVLGCLADCADCLPKDPCAELEDARASNARARRPCWEPEPEAQRVRHPRPQNGPDAYAGEG
ncbi:unnamed protein product, partial [Scytosiphon promiscuus]